MATDHKNSPAALQGAISKPYCQLATLLIYVNHACTSNIKGLVTTFKLVTRSLIFLTSRHKTVEYMTLLSDTSLQ